MPDMPELATPAHNELRVLVIDPGVPAPDQGVGHGEAPQFVEVDHPDPVVRLSGDVQSPTTWTAV